MINAARSHRNLLISLLATLSIHIILLFFSSQIFQFDRENDAESAANQKLIIEFKFVGEEESKSENKVFAQSDAKRGKKPQDADGKPKPKLRKVRTLKFQENQSFRKQLPLALQNTSLAQSNSTFSLEIPKGVPEEELNELQRVLYSFYLRLQGQYVSTLVDKYMEEQRINPRFQVPINRDRDRVTLRATYDLNGNIIRIRTLLSARHKDHSDFFLEAVKRIETIPNPPDVLLDDKKQFHVNYDLRLNPIYY